MLCSSVDLHLYVTNAGQQGETAYSPLSYSLDRLYSIVKKIDLQDEDCALLARKVISKKITHPIVTQLLQNTDPMDYDLGSSEETVVYYSGLFGDQDVVTDAIQAVLQPDSVEVNLRKGYYTAAVANGDEAIYNEILSRYQSELNPHERRRLLYALTSALDPKLITRTLDLAISPSVNSQVSVENVYRYPISDTRSVPIGNHTGHGC